MPIKGVWADEYQGPRYRYYSPYRPITPTLLPAGYTVVLRLGQDPRVIVTTEPLPEGFIKQWDLERKGGE